MMLYGEGVRGVRPWTVTNEGDVWLTHNRKDGAVYAFADLDRSVTKSGFFAGKRFTLQSVRATPETKITLLEPGGGMRMDTG